MDTRIYTITHKTFTFPANTDTQVYIPLHVGRALGQDLGYIGDDTGDNISEKNRSYCELTGMYWIWKNVTCDLVGIAQYRRYLICGPHNDVLTREQIEDGLSKYDMLMSISRPTAEGSIYENYKQSHYIKDLATCREVIAQLYPEDVQAFDLAISCDMFSGGNLFAAKKEVYDAYCEWLFSILFEVEKRTDIAEYDTYQKRIYGFLAERLSRVFVLAGKLHIKEVRVGRSE